MIQQERMLSHVLDLIQIDSESRQEKDVALRLKHDLDSMGAETVIDEAGEKVHGNSGNLFARFKATDPSLAPLFLSAHMDTVVPGRGVRPRVEGARIVSDGSTVLGADDKSGCSVIVEVMRALDEGQFAHGEIEICFTICEEIGLLGAKHFDASRLKSKYGVVLDSDEVSLLFTEGPAADRMEWVIRGLEAHAGVEPEKGISAIRIAAQAIGPMRFGRIDHETTANIGVIEGHGATNIVSREVRVLGEARSRDLGKLEEQTRHMSDCFHRAVQAAPAVELDQSIHRASLQETIQRDYEKLEVADDSPAVAIVMRAAQSLGMTIQTASMGGGCDANIFNRKGVECVNLGSGMRAIHTVKEWLDLEEFYRSAELLLRIVRQD